MPIVVDTYNVLHVTGVLPAEIAGIDVEGLAGLIENSRYSRVQTWLICDGTGGGKRRKIWFSRNILIEYCGPGKDADSAISSMVDLSSSPRRMLVVSSDGSVVRGARRRRCRVESAQKFLQELAHDSQRHRRPPGRHKQPSLSADQVARWVRTFGIGPEFMSIPGSNDAESRVASKSRPVKGTQDGSILTDTPAPGPLAGSPLGSPAGSPPGSPSTSRRSHRALEHVKRLKDVDPAELERFDMREWLP